MARLRDEKNFRIPYSGDAVGAYFLRVPLQYRLYAEGITKKGRALKDKSSLIIFDRLIFDRYEILK